MQQKPRRASAHLLGIGLDHKDGHKRLTRAEEFTIAGGSAETHERMTETVVKTFEQLKREGRQLRSTEPKRLADMLRANTPSA